MNPQPVAKSPARAAKSHRNRSAATAKSPPGAAPTPMAHRQERQPVVGEGQVSQIRRRVTGGLPSSGGVTWNGFPGGSSGSFPGCTVPSTGFPSGSLSGFPTGAAPSGDFTSSVTFNSVDQAAAEHGSFMSLFNNPFIPHSAFSSPRATSNKFIDLEKDDSSDKGGSHVPDNIDTRTMERLLWKQDEDCRLMSAWLKHSIDSRDGNAKKGEKYWRDVAKEYNLSTPQNRKRNVKQVKERWHKINKWTNWFNDAWIKVKGI